MTNQKVIAAIYIRVSTREQALAGYSLAAQERLLTEYCRARKYSIYNTYRDEGISAKDIKHRPGLLSLLEDSKKGCFNTIIVWKLTRFSRNLADLTATCEELDKRGVSLISYSEAFDSHTPAGRMVRSMLGTVAQFEREVIAENVSLGMLERAKQGKRMSHGVLGYDHDGKDSFKINIEEAEKVHFIYDNYLIRKSLTEVQRLCLDVNITGKRGQDLTPQSVLKILTNPVFAGYNVFKGKLYKGNHPPIISINQFNKVQRTIIRQGKISGQPRRTNLFYLPED